MQYKEIELNQFCIKYRKFWMKKFKTFFTEYALKALKLEPGSAQNELSGPVPDSLYKYFEGLLILLMVVIG